MTLSRRAALHLIAQGATLTAASRALDLTGQTAVNPASPLLTRTIPSSNEKLPVIGLGTWQTFDVGDTPAETIPLEEVLKAFVDLGGKLIDSSPMYGRSEEVAGNLASKLKLHDKLFIATKVWTSGKAAGIQQMESSAAKLKAPRMDLMQVHNLVDVQTHLETLQSWKSEGRIRYIGVTHYHAGSHDAVARVLTKHPIDFVQINYSVGERDAEKRLLPLARERGIAVVVNRPFAGGELIRRLSKQPVPSWAADADCQTWAQLLLKFVISHPSITCAIPATSKVNHLRDNMAAGAGRLPDENLRAKIAAEALR
ncbi:MAG TPA: aldo/keto reductase [Opitutaceae bacterium]|nr:aldo/keto reductase [Opitutaceae bacterium]